MRTVTQQEADIVSAALHAVGFALALLLGVRAWAVADPGALA
jgi:hypothetical protein